MRDDAGRLQDILDSIQRIEERIGGGRERFEADEMLQCGWFITFKSSARQRVR